MKELARSRDNNGRHIAILVVMYALLTGLLLAFLSWNMASTPFAYEFLQSAGIAGVENLTDEAVRQVWFSLMAEAYGWTAGLSALLLVVWNLIFRKAGGPGRKTKENLLFAVFLAVHVLMTLLVSIFCGVFGFATSMTLDLYDILAYYGLFLYNVVFFLGLWLFSPIGMRSSLFKKW